MFSTPTIHISSLRSFECIRKYKKSEIRNKILPQGTFAYELWNAIGSCKLWKWQEGLFTSLFYNKLKLAAVSRALGSA